MPAAILAADTGGIVSGAVVLVGALGLALAAERLLRRQGLSALPDVDLSPRADTRLRFLRRAVVAALLIVGGTLAAAQFADLNRLAGTVLASSAIVAAIVGFAARQVLANAIAGLVIAITQPVRIGDVVTVDEQTGVIEDITLTYTWLRAGSNARLIVPNERLAQATIRNDSIGSDTVALEVSAWLAPEADEGAALRAVAACDGVTAVRVADVAESGAIRLLVAGPPGPPAERIAREGDLRAAVLAALRAAGVPRAGMDA
jgi:small-conductance mechanosensitive channel